MDPSERLRLALDHARHFLPRQGPIGTFIHHNTLHAFEHLPFHDAITAACDVHDAQGYLSEERYREALASGRIEPGDLDRALELRARGVPDRVIGPLSARGIERLLLVHGIDAESPAGLRWALGECGASAHLRADVAPPLRLQIVSRTADWIEKLSPAAARQLDTMLAPIASLSEIRRELCGNPERAAAESLWALARALAPARRDRVQEALLARTGRDRTHRDLLAAVASSDPASRTNDALVRFLVAYLDEGMARWPMPHRERGLRACFVEHLSLAPPALPRWERRALERLRAEPEPAALAIAILGELGVAEEHWGAYLTRVLLEQPGWSGMVARLEACPGDRPSGAPPASLLELAAIRLALGIESALDDARAIGHEGSLTTLADTARRIWARDERRRAHDAPWRLFQLCQLAGISAPDLLALGRSGAAELLDVLDGFDELARRRTFHEAYEAAHAREVLGAIADNIRAPAYPEPADPRFQIVFCIDDREEGIRRHLEELDARHVTLGAAGFFGVAMRYRGIDSPAHAAHCPVGITPTHTIDERAHPDHELAAQIRARRRALFARVRHEIGDASRSFARGAALTPVLGLLAAVPLIARVLAPRRAADLARALEARALPSPPTDLTLAHTRELGSARGFMLEERIERVRAQLENVGLRRFAPLVVLLGHEAETVNNPHHSAYDCGACGGRSGGPNARAFAAIANDPEVRAGLHAAGISIPETTWFLGGLHNTTTDAITLYDDDRAPPALHGEIEALRAALETARRLSAHERCRRFEHAASVRTPEQALAHVEERAVDLGQARPELGHVTNAVCVIGRRARTRGLFLDRRAFLQSYDPNGDPDGRVLGPILAALVPVVAGISLEYFFSSVDGERWGCGTKLPHNLGALLGVLEGSSGDLRTGLPRQMVEIHEPLRLLCLVEARPDLLLAIADRLAAVGRLIRNGWVRLVAIDPENGALSVYGEGRFAPWAGEPRALPIVARSLDWYAGRHDFVPPARIEPMAQARSTEAA